MPPKSKTKASGGARGISSGGASASALDVIDLHLMPITSEMSVEKITAILEAKKKFKKENDTSLTPAEVNNVFPVKSIETNEIKNEVGNGNFKNNIIFEHNYFKIFQRCRH